ncbi:hypothetical protein ACHMW7_03890 [Aminobacter sp. UC22_36]|uniref:hypothetical protein n=1 Tax=Aminobacter sp. UC22_36 TaxID=3374549 RepID=UPI0037578787
MIKTAESRAVAYFKFANEHMALFTVMIAGMGLVSSLLFITGYLMVFDWRLIWVIEYQDLIKIGLIAIVFVLSLLISINAYLAIGYDAAFGNGTRSKIATIVVASMLILTFGGKFYGDWTSKSPQWVYHFIQLLTAVTFFMLAVRVASIANRSVIMTFENILSDSVIIAFFIGLLGFNFGHYTRYSKGFRDTVVLDDAVLNNTGVIMYTSHDLILSTSDNTILIVPASRLKEIRSADNIKK